MDNTPRFPLTSWSLVSKVRSDDSALVADALTVIYQRYRYPLYCWLRRKNLAHPDAEDVLQDFFARFIRRRSLEQAEPDRGRLRGFLVTSLGNHLRDWLDRNARRPGPLGNHDLELLQRYESEPFHTSATPDIAYERAWALSVIHATVDRLGEQYRRRGKGTLFEKLRPILAEGGSLRGHDTAAIAMSLAMTEDALRAALHRMLKEFGGHLHAEVAETVATKDEIEPEIRHLLSLFSLN